MKSPVVGFQVEAVDHTALIRSAKPHLSLRRVLNFLGRVIFTIVLAYLIAETVVILLTDLPF